MEKQLPELEQTLGDVRLALLNKQSFAFLFSLFSSFNFIYSEKTKSISLHPSNEVGVKNEIHINPKWFNSLSTQHKATAIAHELMHYALQHDLRKGGRKHQLWNEASDIVVNNALERSGFEIDESPFNITKRAQYKDMSTEEIYQILEQEGGDNSESDGDSDDNNSNSNSNGNGNGNGTGDSNKPLSNDLNYGNSNENNPPSIQYQNQRNRELADAEMNQKQATGKSAGNFGSDFEKLFDKIKKGSVSWQVILAEYLDSLTKGERSFVKFERRYLGLGLYLPANKDDLAVERIAVAVDVSGSVAESQIEYFLNEIRSIKNQMNPQVLDVITFNHSLVDKFSFKQDEEIKGVELHIGGGTDLEPVWEHFSKPKNKPTFLIVFSDMYVTPIPKDRQNTWHTIWMSIDNEKPVVEFGKVIPISSEDMKD